MDEEMIIIETEEVVDGEVYVEDIEQNVEQQEETIEYIEVEDAAEIDIEIKEGTGWAGGDPMHHHSLSGRDEADQHEIHSITGLEGKLKKLSDIKNLYTIDGGVAEFREWEDGKLDSRIGYFVSLNADGCIEICNTESADVYGVTVNHSGICGNQDDEYNIFKSGNDKGNGLRPFAKVCLLGTADVVFSGYYDDIHIGDYVIPNKEGCAVKSENNIGFRVVMKKPGGIGEGLNAVTIALVPQNDNVARVMKELEETNKGLGTVIKDLEDLDETVKNNISISGDFEELEKKVDTKLEMVDNTLSEVQNISSDTKETISNMTSKYEEAKKTVDEAIKQSSERFEELNTYKETLNPLVQYKDNIAGFFSEANENGVTMGSLAQGLKDAEAGLSMIKQSNDAIQHLVCSVDLYTVGYKSPTNGLSRSQAAGALGAYEYIYVPIDNHTEEYNEWSTEFIAGKSYKWVYDKGDNEEHSWKEDVNTTVVFNENPPDDAKGNDLWYTANGSVDGEYKPGTLYRLTKGSWVAVATINDKNARTMSWINQTAEEISSTITNVAGDVSQIRQDVGNINLTVADHTGKLSEIDQTADNIRLGVTDPGGGTSSLELLLSGLRNDVSKTGHVWVCEILNTTPNGPYYTTEPMWDVNKFVFSGETSDDPATGLYCQGKREDIYYQITEDGYDVYTNGNAAIASLRTDVTDTKAEVESWTDFKTDVSDTMTKITQNSSVGVAEMAHMVMGKYLNKVESVVNPTEEQLADLKLENRSNEEPVWEDHMFVLKGDIVENGKYCISYGLHCYYDLTLDDNNNIIGYDKYEMKSSNYSSIVQKVEDGKSYVGLVAGYDKNMGSVIARTINDKSEVLIEADKIGINGLTVFRDNLADGTTTISGNYIKTGTIASNNYSGPVTYKMYGVKLEDNWVCSFYPHNREYTVHPDGSPDSIIVELDSSEHFIGRDLNIAVGTYYYKYNNEWHQIDIKMREKYFPGQFVYEYYCSDVLSHIPSDILIDVYLFPDEAGKVIYNSGKNDYLYYTPKVNGALSIEDGYYYAADIKINEPLLTKQGYDALSNEQKNSYVYIVSESEFELIPSDIEINGMKLDLDLGTIYSKNLVLDKYGNLSITGEISATSGWIGNKDGNGFEIKSRKNGNKTEYYLGNNQISYNGSVLPDGVKKGDAGVYIGPDGIGLGNGYFHISPTGEVAEISGGTLRYIREFDYGTGKFDKDGKEIMDNIGPVFGICFNGPISFGQHSTLTNYQYASLLLTPRSMADDSNNAKLELMGSMWMSGTLTQNSDSRLKTNIVDSNISAIDLIKKIKIKSFDWIDSGEHIDMGVIAQQLEQIIPGLVTTDERTGLKSIAFTNFIPYLIKAIQELSEIANPSMELMSLDNDAEADTHWIDDMNDDEKQYYVELSRGPKFSTKNE